MNFKERMLLDIESVERELDEYLACRDSMFPQLFEAMKYTAMAGGKRIRAFLVMMFSRLSGGNDEMALPFACALEMVHAYSLIHDDLPCMDDDDMRRGKPSNHKVFGEAEALLAGDGLLTYAFEVCASNTAVAPEGTAKAVKILSHYAGPCGMVGGQVLDLEGEKRKLSYDELIHVHELKTAALIKAACMLGCCVAPEGEKNMKTAEEYAQRIGLTFQIIDDILDVTSDEQTLGKPIGSDSENNKTTFLSFMTIDEAKSYALRLTDEAAAMLDDSECGVMLKELAYYLLERNK